MKAEESFPGSSIGAIPINNLPIVHAYLKTKLIIATVSIYCYVKNALWHTL